MKTSDNQQISEHAMRAASYWYSPHITGESFVVLAQDLAEVIDQRAIAPAVAERDKRIAELKLEADAMREWLALIAAGAENAQSLAKLALRGNKDLYAKHGGSHE